MKFRCSQMSPPSRKLITRVRSLAFPMRKIPRFVAYVYYIYCAEAANDRTRKFSYGKIDCESIKDFVSEMKTSSKLQR